jgi:hypothetical protein
VISRANHSHQLVRDSGECVINVPTTALTNTVVDIGNTSGADIDKFDAFGLTAEEATRVKAPMIAECHANFECRLADDGHLLRQKIQQRAHARRCAAALAQVHGVDRKAFGRHVALEQRHQAAGVDIGLHVKARQVCNAQANQCQAPHAFAVGSARA